jgi:hypothetical protein
VFEGCCRSLLGNAWGWEVFRTLVDATVIFQGRGKTSSPEISKMLHPNPPRSPFSISPSKQPKDSITQRTQRQVTTIRNSSPTLHLDFSPSFTLDTQPEQPSFYDFGNKKKYEKILEKRNFITPSLFLPGFGDHLPAEHFLNGIYYGSLGATKQRS